MSGTGVSGEGGPALAGGTFPVSPATQEIVWNTSDADPAQVTTATRKECKDREERTVIVLVVEVENLVGKKGRVVLFGDDADKWNLVEGKWYCFKGGRVKEANKKYSRGIEKELHATRYFTVEACVGKDFQDAPPPGYLHWSFRNPHPHHPPPPTRTHHPPTTSHSVAEVKPCEKALTPKQEGDFHLSAQTPSPSTSSASTSGTGIGMLTGKKRRAEAETDEVLTTQETGLKNLLEGEDFRLYGFLVSKGGYK